MSRVAFPFATLREEAVDVTPWQVHSGGHPVSNARSVDAWDYGVELQLRRDLRVNWDVVQAQLGNVSRDAEFDIVVTAGTGIGSYPRVRTVLWTGRLTDGTGPVEIVLTIPGNGLSSRLHVETAVILARPAQKRSDLSPGTLGARLWRNVEDLALEGDASRFPMEAISFRRQFPGAGRDEALWLLHWHPSAIQSDFMGAVRLYLNSDQTEFLERFRTGDTLVMRMVLAGVMAEMASTILAMDDGVDAIRDGEPASVAGRVRGWLGLAFPGVSLATVREKLRSRPGEFHAALQAASRTES
jgi:hypothetical protein